MTKKLQFNEHSGVPMYQQLADVITREIADGVLEPGTVLPAFGVLSEQYRVPPHVARDALAYLRRQGIVSGGRGRVTEVLRAPTVARMTEGRYRHHDEVSPIVNDLKTAGEPGKVHGRSSVEAASKPVADRLNIEPGDQVSRIDYRFDTDHGPFERSTQWEPLAITGDTPVEVPPETGEPNVIARMASIGYKVDAVREEWSARMPTAAESKELELEEARPVMVCVRTHYAGDTPVETADICIRSDRTAVVVEHPVKEH